MYPVLASNIGSRFPQFVTYSTNWIELNWPVQNLWVKSQIYSTPSQFIYQCVWLTLNADWLCNTLFITACTSCTPMWARLSKIYNHLKQKHNLIRFVVEVLLVPLQTQVSEYIINNCVGWKLCTLVMWSGIQ